MNTAEHYTYRVHWSPEDECFIATVAEMPSLSWAAQGRVEALEGIFLLAADIVNDMASTGETPPVPVAERAYSGKFVVRVPPEVHRRLALEASEQGVSLNMLAATRLGAA